MRRTVFLPVGLIKKATDEGWLRSLGYFIRMKSLYYNNTHYNFSLRSLADRMKCSPACLSHHIKILKSKNIIVNHGKNITFRGLAFLQKEFGYKNIGVPVNSKNQHDILRSQLIRFNLNQQEYRIKRSESKHVPSKQNNTLFVPASKKEKNSSEYAGLSVFGFGKVLGLSPASGYRIRKKLSKLGVLKCERRYSIIMKNVSRQLFTELKRLSLIPVYSIYREGDIIVQRRMKIGYIINPPINVKREHVFVVK